MKTFAIPALAAALALGACSEANAPEATDDGEVVAQETVPAPSETTVVVEDDAMESGDSVTIGEGGVEADVGDENTRVRADVDGDPTLTVETD